MKFTIDKDVILRETAHALEIISTRNAITVLSNVFLAVDEGALTLRASDLKVNYQARVPVDMQRDGVTTVPCDKLAGILRSSPAGDIEFESSAEGMLAVRPQGRRIDFTLKTLPPDRFPEFPATHDSEFVEVPQSDFVEMIAQTIFAVSDDETRYFMNGTFLDQADGELMMVATDSHRLAYCMKQIEPALDGAGVIVPPKILTLIRKFCTGEGSLQLAIADRNLHAQVEHRRINSGLIDAQFPNVKSVIPESQEHRLVVDRSALTEALRRVSVLVEQKSRRVRLEVEAGQLTVQCSEGDVGTAREELPCEYQGPASSLALNYQYLLDPLREMDTDQVALAFTAPNKAITLSAEPERHYFHIIMPMQVG